MTAPVTPATHWQWPADVLALAAEKKVEPYLEPMLELTRRAFPTASWIKVRMQQDPELRDERCILFDVQVALTPQEAGTARKQWIREALGICPAPLITVFSLFLDLVD